MKFKALKDQLARIGAQLQGIVDKAKAENNRGLTSEEREQFHALEADFTGIEDSIKAAEKVESIDELLKKIENGTAAIDETNIDKIRAEFRLSPAEKRRRENDKDPHAKAFGNYMRNGENSDPKDRAMLSQLSAGIGHGFQNAQSGTTGSQGGFLIPQGFSGQLEEAKKWFGGIEGTVDKFTTGTGNPLPWPTINDTTNRGRIIGQNVQLIETDLTFNQVTFNAYIGSSDLILVPLALIEDSYFDLDMLVTRLLGIRLGRLYNWKCTVGTGSSEPTGIVTAAVASGNTLYAGGSSTSGSTASIAYNDLVNLQHAVDPAYRDSAKFMFTDTLLKLLKKLVDGNSRPLWQPGLTASFQNGAGVVSNKPKILESEYVINQDMAIPAASAYSALYGDMSTYKVREVAGGTTLLVLRERYADYLQVGYTAFQRFDGNLVNAGTNPIAVLQQSAS